MKEAYHFMGDCVVPAVSQILFYSTLRLENGSTEPFSILRVLLINRSVSIIFLTLTLSGKWLNEAVFTMSHNQKFATWLSRNGFIWRFFRSFSMSHNSRQFLAMARTKHSSPV